jgi:hypothetical protein
MNTNKQAERRELSKEDKRAAARLRAMWHQHVAERRAQGESITQQTEAEKMGWSQGNFSLYLNEHVPIGPKALETLCPYFGCKKWHIRPELADKDMTATLEAAVAKLEALTADNPIERAQVAELLERGHMLVGDRRQRPVHASA